MGGTTGGFPQAGESGDAGAAGEGGDAGAAGEGNDAGAAGESSAAGGESAGGEGGVPNNGSGATSGTGQGAQSGSGGTAGASGAGDDAGAGGAGPVCGDDYQVVVGEPTAPAQCRPMAFNVCAGFTMPIGCVNSCQSDSECENSGTTWYAIYTCPGTSQFWIGNPGGAYHCDSDMVQCPPGMVELSCEDTCAGNPSCEESGETWYAHLVCGRCP